MSLRKFSKQLETKATFTSQLYCSKKKRKDGRTKIYSCRYVSSFISLYVNDKLEESKAYVLVINVQGLHTT